MTDTQIIGVILLETLCLGTGWMIGMATMDEGQLCWHRIGIRMMQIGGYSLVAEFVIFCICLVTGLIS